MVEKEESTEVVVKLALEIVPFFLKHNAEADACDLLLELEIIPKLADHVDKDTYQRVGLYILRYLAYSTLLTSLNSVFSKLSS